MRVMDRIERAAINADLFQCSMTLLLVMLSEANTLTEILRFAQNDSFEYGQFAVGFCARRTRHLA